MVRNSNDYYPTPHSFVDALVSKIPFSKKDVIWECCAGDYRLVRKLRTHGYEVRATDLANGKHQDFFKYDYPLTKTIITNPPFKVIRNFIDHAFYIGIEQMILFCNERLFACQKGFEQWSRYRPSHFINLTWREDYLGKGGSPDRSMAIAIWDKPHSNKTEYQIWSNK